MASTDMIRIWDPRPPLLDQIAGLVIDQLRIVCLSQAIRLIVTKLSLSSTQQVSCPIIDKLLNRFFRLRQLAQPLDRVVGEAAHALLAIIQLDQIALGVILVSAKEECVARLMQRLLDDSPALVVIETLFQSARQSTFGDLASF